MIVNKRDKWNHRGNKCVEEKEGAMKTRKYILDGVTLPQRKKELHIRREAGIRGVFCLRPLFQGKMIAYTIWRKMEGSYEMIS